MPNINNNLIIIKGEDKTASIRNFAFEQHKPVVWITYNSGRQYPYNTDDVIFLKNPNVTVIKDQIVLINGVPKSGVTIVQEFEMYCRLIFKNNYTELCRAAEVKIVDSALSKPDSKSCFEYLKEIAYQVGLYTPDGHNILGARYSKIDFIREDSILASFLSGELKDNCYAKDKTAVFPFGFNVSQKMAVDNALNYKLSVIEGPPGTGKTQTILNIIANAIMRGESVAVVSSNNSATSNVLQKLQKYNVGFIAAPLGSKKNKEAFVENQSADLPDMTSWKLDTLEYLQKIQTLHSEAKALDDALLLKNELSKLSQESETVTLESEHFSEYLNNFNLIFKPSFYKAKASSILLFVAEYDFSMQDGRKINFLKRAKWLLKYGIVSSKFLKEPAEKVISYCYSLYYKRRSEEIARRITKIEKELAKYDFHKKLEEYSELSAVLFRAKLQEKFEGVRSRYLYSQDDLWKHSDQFIKDYPVVLSTTYSLRASLSNQFVYD